MDIFDFDIFNLDVKDLAMFSNFQEARVVHLAVGLLCMSELLIWIYASLGKRERTRDVTLWMVIGAWCWGVGAGKILRDTDMPSWVQSLLFPHVIYYLGVVLIVLGVIVRCTAVITLRHAFTHNVQTTSDQHLIQSGLYRWVRNPAYTGSIISLIGTTFAYRSIVASLSVFAVCVFCYGLRIYVEERALKEQFGEEFEEYCHKVKYRLIPGVY